MIFVGGKVDFLFRTRIEATKRVLECGLNDEFNVVLYADYTGVVDGECDKVCFLVPVHYPSFVLSFDLHVSLEKSVDKLFEFDGQDARDALCRHIRRIGNRNAEKIAFLR